ncbi:MAG: hypothetical protein PHQ00_03895 [Phycisphaerae bacterium]|nr:hypothetical protein [Phycisphaerae bacterium]
MKIVCIFLCFCAAMPNRCRGKTQPEAPSRQEGSAGDITDSNGPTLILNYSKETFKKNPILAFAYFIPLISPALVDREISIKNTQMEGIISYKRTVTSNSFYAAGEFELSGKGFHKNTFDPEGMIARNIGDVKKGEPLTNILDYIKFEGDGVGIIEIRGTISGSTQTVTEVDICFSARKQKSPVTIGLYSVKPQNGQYKYENRYNELIARVDTLAFSKSEEDNPRMGIEIASIHKKTKDESYWSRVKGFIANFFIKPLEVDKIGNDTMLKFGYAILNQEPEFTFPKAKNIKETRTVVTGNQDE